MKELESDIENEFVTNKKDKKRIKSGCAWCGEFHGHFTTVRDDDGRPERVCLECAESAGY